MVQTTNQFSAIRDFADVIRACVDNRGIVSFSWDGDVLRVSHAMPEETEDLMVMSFSDVPHDFLTPDVELIASFAVASKEHFGG